MEQTLFFVYHGCLLVSAIMAIIYRKPLTKWHLAIMALYLPLVFLMEVYQASRLYIWKNSTPIVYNIYRPVSVVVFAMIYSSIPFMSRFRKPIIGITAAYLLIIIITYSLFPSIFSSNNTYLTLARGICMVFFGLFFLISFFRLDNVAEETFWQPLIWITIGVVIFYPVISISIGFEEYLRFYKATLSGHKLYQAIPRVMGIFMYCCFSYAFYLCKKKS